ncbi:MAG TPA: AbrB/MazE/SpoVT family DNA-binding domain-containing protein [Acidobacteriota bacterium]|jgi:AbrB family looped-hinge helix DNA binding protein|nr:AbrB/MazE/SpoVT family DNA-binding domain-containing protein [Acidobacteriota bacterium]
MRTKVTKRGQVSIPSEIRRKLQIAPDSTVEWVLEGSTAKIIPLPADPLKAFRGSGKQGLLKLLLKERKKDRKRENGR